MIYEYTSTDKDSFSLHDCHAVKVERKNNKLIFFFPDGIYYAEYSDDWPNTGKAEVEFTIDRLRGVTVYLFKESEEQTIRQEYSLNEFIEKINNGEWDLEFAYRYDGYEEILYRCWIWENNSPWTYECEIWIGTKENMVFRWDSPDLMQKE